MSLSSAVGQSGTLKPKIKRKKAKSHTDDDVSSGGGGGGRDVDIGSCGKKAKSTPDTKSEVAEAEAEVKTSRKAFERTTGRATKTKTDKSREMFEQKMEPVTHETKTGDDVRTQSEATGPASSVDGPRGASAKEDALQSPPPLPAPCCPITLEPFVDPVLLSDGHTYEREAIRTWMAPRSAATPGALSPVGIPLPTLAYVPNRALRDRVCPLTREAYVRPVCLFPIEPRWTEIEWGVGTFESDALIAGLAATWVRHDPRGLTHYTVATGGSSIEGAMRTVDLNTSHVLIPNRVIASRSNSIRQTLVASSAPQRSSMPSSSSLSSSSSRTASSSSGAGLLLSSKPSATPCDLTVRLPTRSPPPRFDKTLLKNKYSGVCYFADNGEEKLQQFVSNPLNHYASDESHHRWQNLTATDWMLQVHGKMYVFVNCYFENCLFKSICWCAITFQNCRFVKCTWLYCDPKSDFGTNMVDNEFERCVVVHRANDYSTYVNPPTGQDMVRVLVGIQTDASAARVARSGISLCVVES